MYKTATFLSFLLLSVNPIKNTHRHYTIYPVLLLICTVAIAVSMIYKYCSTLLDVSSFYIHNFFI
jgi:hypothetical protein